MSHSERAWPRLKKQPGTDAGTAPNPGHAQPPATFFLRSEREMQRAEAEKSSRRQDHDEDNNYGVESLNDTLEAAFAPEPPERPSSPSNPASAKKRKIGNPVHPKIAAAAQRIISSEERPSSRTSSITSPAQRPLTPSPTRRRVRSESLTSLGRSFTPLRTSDGSTRSPSVKSVRLSDEEGSIIDDTASQALHSSSEDDDVFADDTMGETASLNMPQSSIPQLVMPSISMPARRPFTERGKRIPRLRIMVAGPSGIGKTSLIKSIVQACGDIVHVDPAVNIDSSSTSATRTDNVFETHASTRSYPSWWSEEIEQGRGLRRRKSMGDSILERNISLIDTPGWIMSGASDRENMADTIGAIHESIEASFRRNALTGELSDTDLLGVLSGNGGFQVDVILYMFHPSEFTMFPCGWKFADNFAASHQINPPEIDVLRRLSTLTNIVPIIGRADTCTSDNLMDTKTAIRSSLEAAGIRTFTFHTADAADASAPSPFAVSSALSEDAETLDASVLMSSEYVQPLVSSDLSQLVDQLFDPDNAQWLRHCAVKKFIQWRRDYLKSSFDSHKRELRELALERLGCLHDAAPSSISSMFSSPSGFLAPQVPTPSQRGASPTPFRLVPAMGTTSQYDFGRRIDAHDIDGESMQLPQWAYNLKIALNIENRERKQLTMGTHERHNANSALIRSGHDISPHSKSSDLENFDHRDPLGLLALSQRLNVSRWSLLQVVGGCGAVATILVWVTRNWATVPEALGLSTPSVQIPGYAAVSARENSKAPLGLFKAFLTGGKW